MVFAFDVHEYFPENTEWKEVIVELDAPLDTIFSITYKICGDTLISNTSYRKVSVNGKDAGLWLREADNCIWLLTADYPHEIKLYDFNWKVGEALQTEYLRETDSGEMTLHTDVQVYDYKTIDLGTASYQYYMDSFYCTVIRGIGRVSELNRNCSLLGYKLPDIILPGLLYHKVLWFRRNGQIIFKSEEADEWVTYIPTNIVKPAICPSNSPTYYDLQGRRLNAQPQRGVYIQNGKKYVAK